MVYQNFVGTAIVSDSDEMAVNEDDVNGIVAPLLELISSVFVKDFLVDDDVSLLVSKLEKVIVEVGSVIGIGFKVNKPLHNAIIDMLLGVDKEVEETVVLHTLHFNPNYVNLYVVHANAIILYVKDGIKI